MTKRLLERRPYQDGIPKLKVIISVYEPFGTLAEYSFYLDSEVDTGFDHGVKVGWKIYKNLKKLGFRPVTKIDGILANSKITKLPAFFAKITKIESTFRKSQINVNPQFEIFLLAEDKPNPENVILLGLDGMKGLSFEFDGVTNHLSVYRYD